MDLKELLSSFAQITVFAVMLSMGMALGFEGMGRLWRRPSLLLRCFVAAFVVVPVAAMVVTRVLPLTFEVRAGIAAMAVIPGAPLIYRKMLKGPGDVELAGSFQATMALLSIVLVPLWFGIISAMYPNDAAAPLAVVFKQVMLMQGVPLLVGAAIAHWLPDLADDFNEPLNRISSAMLVGVVLLVAAMGLSLVLKAGPVPILAVVLMAAAGLLSGHYLGGSDPVTRQTIAVANASRNAGLSLALVTLNFPAVAHEVLVTIAAYAIMSGIASKIYTRLYQKQLARGAHPQDAPGF
ncbi:bile acid:sodium symporter [Leptolyngbya sp. CCNP1308]|uniref:bile acid:sodium symporter family protein n=1 Tax=Leptolyngbya sp. CCNP1308 TaxID=3110255 RepID=UPI002B216B6E|nr:bile acid:sodium symporter [Leptolyngbya sp. CCNP1308]MEA5448406.1 bile acid:sodium symporter [Leptolyngbya sp. CCNP1308]